MDAFLAYAIALTVAVLVSERSRRTILSTAVLFLVAGFLLGRYGEVRPDRLEEPLATLALYAILFTDAMRIGGDELRRFWRLPGRALLLGLPLTVAGTAVLAHVLVDLRWDEAFLMGAVLSPTDPAFAAAIVGREQVPLRLRHLLNVESGLNDGLALPLVVALLAHVQSERAGLGAISLQMLGGVALGVAVPLVILRLEQTRHLGASERARPGLALSIGLLVLAVAPRLGVNLYLAAFAAGLTVAFRSERAQATFQRFGGLIAELLKLAALLVFGALVSPRLLADIPVSGWIFAAADLALVRPAALAIALLRSGLPWREWLAAAWFGPKGFASVVYGMMVLRAGIPGGDRFFHLVAVVVAGSIVAHSSTDVIVARWFHREERREPARAADAASASR